MVVLCLIGAATFWFFNALNKDYTSDLRIPLDFQFNTEDNVVFGRLPGYVVVNVSGGGWDLLRKSNLFSLQPLEIPLADPTVQKRIAGASLLPYVNTYLSGQLVLNHIITDSLFLDIDSKVTKMIALDVDSSRIDLAEDVIITSSIRMERDSIRVTGARRYLDTLSSPFVLQIDDPGIDDDYDERINLYLDEIDNIECDPNTIRIEFETQQLITVNNTFSFEMVNFPEGTEVGFSDTLLSVDIKLLPIYQDSISIPLDLIVDYNLVNWDDSTVVPHIKNVPEFIFDATVNSEPIKLLFADAN